MIIKPGPHDHREADKDSILFYFHFFDHQNYTHCKSPLSNPWTIEHVDKKHGINSQYARGYGISRVPQWFRFEERIGDLWNLESGIKVDVEDVPQKFKVCSEDSEKIEFSLVRQLWKGQKVTREGPSRLIWRFLLKLPARSEPITCFSLSDDPILVERTTAFFVPCPDENALGRGGPGENKDYLKPDEKNWWNPTRNTFSDARKIDKGTVLFYIKNSLWKILIKGQHLKGVFVLKKEGSSDQWKWQQNISPGKNIN